LARHGEESGCFDRRISKTARAAAFYTARKLHYVTNQTSQSLSYFNLTTDILWDKIVLIVRFGLC
jgi:hypothetical protein